MSAIAAMPGRELAARGGWAVIPLLGDRALARLLREARAMHAAEGVAVREQLDPERADERGTAARFFETAAGGPALRRLYTAAPLRASLARLTGSGWRPLGGQATYSFYRREGHYLGLHRDIDRCELAVIACLHDDAPASLSLWPSRCAEPLAAIRDEPDSGRVPVRMRPGEAILLLGGVVPHAVEPMPAGRTRITAPMCFQPS